MPWPCHSIRSHLHQHGTFRNPSVLLMKCRTSACLNLQIKCSTCSVPCRRPSFLLRFRRLPHIRIRVLSVLVCRREVDLALLPSLEHSPCLSLQRELFDHQEQPCQHSAGSLKPCFVFTAFFPILTVAYLKNCLVHTWSFSSKVFQSFSSSKILVSS